MQYRQNKRYLRFLEPDRNAGASSEAAGRVMGFLLVFFALGFVYVWLYMQSVKMNYQVNELSKECERLKAENRVMEFNLQGMVSNESVERVARERYGFVSPGANSVVVIKKNKNIFIKMFDGMFKSFRAKEKA